MDDGGRLATESPGRHSVVGRIGRGTKPPPQLGQTLKRMLSTQSAQKVHSKVQMRAIIESGGRSLLQYSQFGRSSRAIVFTFDRQSRQKPLNRSGAPEATAGAFYLDGGFGRLFCSGPQWRHVVPSIVKRGAGSARGVELVVRRNRQSHIPCTVLLLDKQSEV